MLRELETERKGGFGSIGYLVKVQEKEGGGWRAGSGRSKKRGEEKREEKCREGRRGEGEGLGKSKERSERRKRRGV